MAYPGGRWCGPVETGMRRRIRLGSLACGTAAVVAAAIIGSGTELASPPAASAFPKPTASVSVGADKDAAWKWFQEKIPGPYGSMDDALKTWSTAMAAGDSNGMYGACGMLRVAGARFENVLPAPDPRASVRLKGLAKDLYSAADQCQDLPPQADWDIAKPMLAYVDSAKARLKAAKSIMQPNG